MTRPNGHNGQDAHPLCEHEGCTRYGTHFAPKHPPEHGRYRLCLEHVRQYNKNWNFFAYMSASDIERYRKEALIGHRPTWRHRFYPLHRQLLFSIFYNTGESNTPSPPPADNQKTRQALDLLHLKEPLTLHALKKRYHVLVKRYHPDARGGNTDGETMLRAVNEAYWHLKKQMELKNATAQSRP